MENFIGSVGSFVAPTGNQAKCLSQIPAIGKEQPSVMAWSDWRGGCSGQMASYAVPHQVNLYATRSPMANNIDTIYVPPNVELEVDYHGIDMKTPVKINGLKSLGEGIDYPGLYQMDDWGGAKRILDPSTGNSIGIEDIDTIKTRALYPWDEHLAKCCAGEITDKRLCGDYAAGAQVCREVLNKCTGAKLKTDARCKEMCRKDLVACDSIKSTYCSANKTDSWCSCMNVATDPEYITFANKMKEKTGQLPSIGCTPFGRCNTGVDLEDAFIRSSIIEQQKSACPAYDYTEQNLTTIGDNNEISTDMEITTQTGGTSNGTTSSGAGGTSNGTSGGTTGGQTVRQTGGQSSGQTAPGKLPNADATPLLYYILLIVFVFIVGFVLYRIFRKEPPMYDPMQQYGMQQPPMQFQPMQQYPMQPMPQPQQQQYPMPQPMPPMQQYPMPQPMQQQQYQPMPQPMQQQQYPMQPMR